MDMNWFECILYGLSMGFSEFVPISSRASGMILQKLFGAEVNDGVRDLIVHIFALAAFIIAWQKPVDFLRYGVQIPRRRQRGHRSTDTHMSSDTRFVRAAVIPMILVMILVFYTSGSIETIPTVLLLIVNGICLYLPERMLRGNKSARAMSASDAWLIGGCSALCAVPGFSRMGMGISIAQMRGADTKHAINWAYSLSVPALLFLIGADLVGITFGAQLLVLSTGFWGYLLLAISSFVGSYFAVYYMRNIITNRGLCAFAYYSWGAALFMFILYLL